jgi:hypothetical protein
MNIADAIEDDIAARALLGAAAANRIFNLSEAQMLALMNGVTDAQVAAVKQALALTARPTPKLPHARYILNKVYNGNFSRRQIGLDRRASALALAQAEIRRDIGWWRLRERVTVCAAGYVTSVLVPETLTSAQLNKLRGPFVSVLGE